MRNHISEPFLGLLTDKSNVCRKIVRLDQLIGFVLFAIDERGMRASGEPYQPSLKTYTLFWSF